MINKNDHQIPQKQKKTKTKKTNISIPKKKELNLLTPKRPPNRRVFVSSGGLGNLLLSLGVLGAGATAAQSEGIGRGAERAKTGRRKCGRYFSFFFWFACVFERNFFGGFWHIFWLFWCFGWWMFCFFVEMTGFS